MKEDDRNNSSEFAEVKTLMLETLGDDLPSEIHCNEISREGMTDDECVELFLCYFYSKSGVAGTRTMDKITETQLIIKNGLNYESIAESFMGFHDHNPALGSDVIAKFKHNE